MFSAAIRPIALAAVAAFALTAGAEAAPKKKGKSQVYGSHASQPYYGYPQVVPATRSHGTTTNFGMLHRDTRNEGFPHRYGFDWGARGGR